MMGLYLPTLRPCGLAVHHDVSPAQLVEMQVPRADALDSSQFSDPAFLLMQPASKQ